MGKELLTDILSSEYVNELIEFKENWFNKDELGEYIEGKNERIGPKMLVAGK